MIDCSLVVRKWLITRYLGIPRPDQIPNYWAQTIIDSVYNADLTRTPTHLGLKKSKSIIPNRFISRHQIHEGGAK